MLAQSRLRGKEAKPKKQTAEVMICGRTWGEADQKMRDWIKNHPNERILDRIPVVLTTSYQKMCSAHEFAVTIDNKTVCITSVISLLVW